MNGYLKKISAFVSITIVLGLAIWLFAKDSALNNFADAFSRFGLQSIILGTVLGAAVHLAGAFRFWILLRDVSDNVSFKSASRIFFISTLGGLLFFQFFGQMAARSVLLERRGIPVEDTMLLSLVERISAALILFLTGVASLMFLSDASGIGLNFRENEWIYLLLTLLITGYLGYRELLPLLEGVNLRETAGLVMKLFGKSLGISLLIHALTLITFLWFVSTTATEAGLLQRIGACLIVMFCASIPINFAGWGMRELSAGFAFQLIGITAGGGIAVGVGVGICGLLGVIACGLFPWNRKGETGPEVALGGHLEGKILSREVFAFLIGVSIAVLIYLNVHVPVGEGEVNVNLADPVVFVGFVFALASGVGLHRSGRLEIRKAGFVSIAALSLVLLISLVTGYQRIGYTSWAFVSKFSGWFVLMAYLLTGAFVGYQLRDTGFRRGILSVLIWTGVTITLIFWVARLLTIVSPDVFGSVPIRMEGFAKNANAFAFQICIAMSVALVVWGSQRKHWEAIHLFGLGALIVGLIDSTSRAAMVVSLCGLAFLVFWNRDWLRNALCGIGVAVLILLPMRLLEISGSLLASFFSTQKGFVLHDKVTSYRHTPDLHRWKSITDGLEMFRENPILGGGLGLSIHRSAAEGLPVIPHSTPVWILAEMGVVGGIVFALVGFFLIREAIRLSRDEDRCFDGNLMILIIGVLFLFGLVHEMLYQRMFWFVLGLAGFTLFIKGRPEDKEAA